MFIQKTRIPRAAASNSLPEGGDRAAYTQQPAEQIDWLGAQEEVIQLRVALVCAPDYVYGPMTAFAMEADVAAKQTDWERMRAAAREIGKIGLKYLQEASVDTLAELTAKALAA